MALDELLKQVIFFVFILLPLFLHVYTYDIYKVTQRVNWKGILGNHFGRSFKFYIFCHILFNFLKYL